MSIAILDASSDDRPAIEKLERLAFEELRRIYQPSQAALASKSTLDLSLLRIVALGRAGIIGTV